jgi:hypothetical protein
VIAGRVKATTPQGSHQQMLLEGGLVNLDDVVVDPQTNITGAKSKCMEGGV